MSHVTAIQVTPPDWTFGERIRKARRHLGLSQADMAERLGVGRKAYAAWEAEINGPGTKLVPLCDRLAEMTFWPREWFIGWDDKTPPPNGEGVPGNARPEGLEPPTF